MVILNNETPDNERESRARGLVHRNEHWVQDPPAANDPYHQWYGILLYAYRQHDLDEEEETDGRLIEGIGDDDA